MTMGMNKAAEPSPEQTTHELVPLLRSVASGDRSALSALYGRTSAKLFGICTRMLGSEADAEEVLQDVYVTVWQKADRFDASKASPITWLSVLARNKSIDRLRVRKPATNTIDAADEIPDDSASSFDLIVIAQQNELLAACLDQLDERHRAFIRDAFVEGATYPELASREDVPLGTMKSWIRRALISLRKCLER